MPNRIPRNPRFGPHPKLSAQIQFGNGKNRECDIVDINCDGCSVRIAGPEVKSKSNDLTLRFFLDEQELDETIRSEIRHRRKESGNQRLHLQFKEPTIIGWVGSNSADVTEAIPINVESESSSGVEFVNNELTWRSNHVMQRTSSLIKVAAFYVLLLTSLTGYATLGFTFLNGETPRELLNLFSAVGLVFDVVVVFLGIFLLRLSGYVFCSNIMNRKRMAAIRSAFAERSKISDLIPPPFKAEEVWICGGYNSFPYLFAFINFSVLFLNTAFFRLMLADWVAALVLSLSIVLLTAIFYPRACHRYAADIHAAKNFLRKHHEFRDHPTNNHAQLKELYYKVLIKCEQDRRRHQIPLLLAYFGSTAVTIIYGGLYFFLGLHPYWIFGCSSLLCFTTLLRIVTINSRFKRIGPVARTQVI